jgi:site-specific recombinase XerD
LLKQKIDQGDIKSAVGIEKWGVVIPHLIASRLGELYIDQIRTSDILAWKGDMAKKIHAGDYKPATVNTWFSVLKVILKHAKLEYGLLSNPAADVPAFDMSRHRTYTFEEPNSLTVTELQDFLATMRESYPQHFAMTFTGFATGLRPSTLRPLRRGGATPDVIWDKGLLLIRQSQTRGDEVMVGSKTAKDQTISIPTELLAVLRWHVETQLRPGPQRESTLLFPSETGGFRSPTVLDKPFRDVARAIGLRKKISARAMRRSFQDLARAAEVRDIVTRSISGHATEAMQNHYSTVSPNEQKTGLAKVIRLFERPKPTGQVREQTDETSEADDRDGSEEQPTRAKGR